MRWRTVLASLTVFLLLMSLVTGCELMDVDFTMDIDYRTTIETSGNLIQEIVLEVTGISGELLEQAGFSEESFLEEEGWDITSANMDDSVIITATGNYILDKDGNITQIEGGPEIPEGMSVRIENSLLSKIYFVEFVNDGSGAEIIGAGEGFSDLAELLLEDVFSISWTITLPGKIVESNADTIENGSATWDFDFGTLSSGMELSVQSRYTDWPVIGGMIAGGVIVLALVAFFFIRRGRRSAFFDSVITREESTISSQ